MSLNEQTVPIYNDIKDYLDEIRVVSFNKGEYLTRSEEDFKDIYYILSGNIRVECTTQTGKCVLVDKLEPFEFVGKISYLYEQNLCCDIVATNNATLIKIPKHTLTKLEDNPRFMKRFYFMTSKRMYQIYKIMLLQHLFRLEELFSYHLLTHAKNGQYTYESMYSLSSELFASRKNLYNVINQLIKSGYISKEGATLSILNPEALATLSQEVREFQGQDFPY